MAFEPVKLEDLVDMHNPRAVLEEVDGIVLSMFSDFDFVQFHNVFRDVEKLFRGELPGYRKCNIYYHDLKHTTDCLLAMARLIHGAFVSGIKVSGKDASLGLVAALLHDTGYIQENWDLTGTGAKYTLTHIKRSIRFMERYFSSDGHSREDFHHCRNFLECTGLDVHIRDLHFDIPEHEMLGKMLGTADLLGQMATRNYLEKLPFLFREFKEGRVPGFEDEFDLISKTPDFWEFSKERMATELGNMARYMNHHFRVRRGIDRNLYFESIDNNIGYLKVIVRDRKDDYRRYLRRGELIDLLKEIEHLDFPLK
jgi:hypothetical protein